MLLYAVVWREPGYGVKEWVIERELLNNRQSALDSAYAIANAHWKLDEFPENDILEYANRLVLFDKRKVVGEYVVITFNHNG